MERENNGRGLFYGVIGVATLIVAIIGATFAWFTSTGGSGVTPVEIIKSGTLTIEYADGSAIKATNLKPATLDQVKVAAASNCDDVITPGEMLCASYKFTVENKGSLAALITANVALTNPFTGGALQYALLTGTQDADDITATPYTSSIAGLPSNGTLAVGAKDTYTLIFWLDGEAATNNDQTKTLTGTINVTANQTNYTATP